MKLFKLNSVVSKLWLSIILIVTTVLIILTIVLSFYMRNFMLNSLNDEMTSDIHRLQDQVLLTHDYNHLSDIVLRENNLIIYYNGEMISTESSTDYQIFNTIINDHDTNHMMILDDINNQSYLVRTSNLSMYVESNLILIKYESLNSISHSMRAIMLIFATSGIVMVILTTIFAFFLVTRITDPLIQLKQSAFKTARGNYTHVPVKTRDEIGELSLAFNRMNDDIQKNVSQLTYERNLREKVFNAIHEGIVYFDASLNLKYGNKVGDQFVKEINTNESLNFDLKHHLKIALNQNEPFSTVVEYQSKYELLSITPINSKTMDGVILVTRDVTDAINQENMRTEFIANISHELKTPMVMLGGYSEALMDDMITDPNEIKEIAAIIKDETKRMNKMVNEFIEISKMDENSTTFNFKHSDMLDLLASIQQKFKNEFSINAIQFKINYTNEVQVYIDEDKMYQVLSNLIDNAIRYTNPGDSISLLVTKTRTHAVIEVSDNGSGIKEEHQQRVFERFYKVDASRTRGKHGTGLGLYIVKTIVEKHNGTINLNSTYGKGTTFIIQLPLGEGD